MAAHVALAWVAVDRGDSDRRAEHVQAACADHDGLADPVCAAALALVRSRLMRSAWRPGRDAAGPTHWRDRRADATPAWFRPPVRRRRSPDAPRGRCPDAAESQSVRAPHRTRRPACSPTAGSSWPPGAAAESWRTARQVSRLTALPLELVVEAHLLAAASALALSRPEAAAAGVDEAVRLASAEGLLRPFDEVPPRLEALLRQREQHRSAEVPRRADASRAADPAARPTFLDRRSRRHDPAGGPRPPGRGRPGRRGRRRRAASMPPGSTPVRRPAAPTAGSSSSH